MSFCSWCKNAIEPTKSQHVSVSTQQHAGGPRPATVWKPPLSYSDIKADIRCKFHIYYNKNYDMFICAFGFNITLGMSMSYGDWALYSHAGCGSSKEHKQNVSVKGRKGRDRREKWVSLSGRHHLGSSELVHSPRSVPPNEHGPEGRFGKKKFFSGCVLNAKATKHGSVTIQHSAIYRNFPINCSLREN